VKNCKLCWWNRPQDDTRTLSFLKHWLWLVRVCVYAYTINFVISSCIIESTNRTKKKNWFCSFQFFFIRLIHIWSA
jgi:hypothetical protein